ncbi:hypothetical protein BJ165DRAFT_1447676 [Panaeolus papilionaceus]|nr:hypothetical protein BJ165DRAFT_1447676 [Panaeolus papilionaceus]
MGLLRPVTSANLPEWYLPSASGWHLFHEPSLLRIKVFCQDELGWTNENTLKERFVKRVLPAITAQMFYSPLVVYSPADTKLATPLHQVTIRNLRWMKRRRHSRVPQPRISLFISNLLDVAGLPKSGGEHILIWALREMIPYELQERA